MKKIIFVAAMAAVLALTGCEKEGNELDVDISQLTGIWIRNNHYPEQVIGGSGISYTFSANGECKKRVFSIPDWTSVFEYTYEVSNDDGTVITFYDKEDGHISYQYLVTKLNAGYMQWKNIKGGEPYVEKYVR